MPGNYNNSVYLIKIYTVLVHICLIILGNWKSVSCNLWKVDENQSKWSSRDYSLLINFCWVVHFEEMQTLTSRCWNQGLVWCVHGPHSWGLIIDNFIQCTPYMSLTLNYTAVYAVYSNNHVHYMQVTSSLDQSDSHDLHFKELYDFFLWIK